MLSLQPEAPPLRNDERGACRIGDSRVLLELVLNSFENGVSPERIVEQYPTTNLGDIYAVIAYYLHHRDEVAAYLRAREKQAEEVRSRIEARQGDLGELRARLLRSLNAGTGSLSQNSPRGRGG